MEGRECQMKGDIQTIFYQQYTINLNFKIKMVFPLNNDTDPYHSFTYYQAIIATEIMATLIIFFVLQSIHFLIWGHDEEVWELKKRQEGEAGLLPLPQSNWRWDQKGWNMYFTIIFTNHIIAVFLPMVYIPQIYVCIFAYCHFTAFLGMMINSVFVTEKKIGQGGKTKTNRIFWVIMCILNLMLIVCGIRGIPLVLK